MISTIRALTAGDVDVTLKYVKSVLWDGSEETYREFFGSEAVRLVISSYVPADRTYYIRSDSYRDECFEVSAQRRFIVVIIVTGHLYANDTEVDYIKKSRVSDESIVVMTYLCDSV